MVLLRIKVPRGRTAPSASSKPEAEPVASMTTSNNRGCQSSRRIVRTPAFLIRASLSACFPSAVIFAPAGIALPATEIDLADDAFTNKLPRSLADRAGEFVAGHALEIHVAFENLQVGGANPGELNLDQGKSRVSARRAVGRVEGEFA